MKLHCKVKQGLRGRWWWRVVDENGKTRAVCSAPGFTTSHRAQVDAQWVFESELAFDTDHKRHPWWRFWN